MKPENHDLETATMIVVCNIQAMQGLMNLPRRVCGLGVRGFDELWAMSLKELRELQDKLIKQYRKTINKGDE